MCLKIKCDYCMSPGLCTHSLKQWAAETIQRLEMMAPPHWWTPSYSSLTCQGQPPCLASTPPTIRSAAKLRLPQSAEDREERVYCGLNCRWRIQYIKKEEKDSMLEWEKVNKISEQWSWQNLRDWNRQRIRRMNGMEYRVMHEWCIFVVRSLNKKQ